LSRRSRVLVTGASSALGKATGRRLQLCGHHATGTVRSRTSKSAGPEFDFLIELDLDHQASIDHLSGHFDAIVHIAAASYGSRSTLMRATGLATRDLAQKAIELGVPRFIHVSSMSVYGSIESSEVSETTPIRHQSPYGTAKWAAENYLHQLQNSLSCISVRSPAIVGAQKNPHFLQRTRNLMEEGRSVVTASNPGFRFNNVIHEDTLAEFLVHLALTAPDGFRALPVGSVSDHTLAESLEYMADETGYEGKIEWIAPEAPPFAINVDEAIAMGLQPLSTRETLARWLRKGQQHQNR